MKCPKCETELVQSDSDSYEDYGIEGEGIVSINTCTDVECDVDTVIIYKQLEQ